MDIEYKMSEMTTNQDSAESTMTTVTATPVSSITDAVTTTVKLVTTARDIDPKQTDEERKKNDCLSMCRNINSVTTILSAYFTETSDLPDAFLLFSFYDKLRTMELTIQSVLTSVMDSSITEAKLGDNVEVDAARKNLKLLFQNFDATLKRIREITFTLSTVPRVAPQAAHPTCGHAHGTPHS